MIPFFQSQQKGARWPYRNLECPVVRTGELPIAGTDRLAVLTAVKGLAADGDPGCGAEGRCEQTRHQASFVARNRQLNRAGCALVLIDNNDIDVAIGLRFSGLKRPYHLTSLIVDLSR
jgi:hypothetical protein